MRKRFIQKGENGFNFTNIFSDPSALSNSFNQFFKNSKQTTQPKTKGISEGTMNTVGDVSNIVGTIADAFPTLDKTKNTNDAYVEQARDFASDALLKSGNPFAMAAGAAVKVIDKTGGFTDASKGLGGGLDAANAFASFALPGVGYFAP